MDAIRGGDNNTLDGGNTAQFNLKLRHGGKLKQHGLGYVGGVIKCFNLDIDLWGMITLRDTLEELGYNMLDKFKIFTPTKSGTLFELVNDSDFWAICDVGLFPKEIEVWVVGDGVGQSEPSVLGDGEPECSDDLEYFDYSDNSLGNDDIEFEGNIDPNEEFDGVGESQHEDTTGNVTENVTRTGSGTVPRAVEDGLHLSDEDSGKDSDDQGERKWPMFRARTDMKDPKFSVGLTFATKSEFRDAVHNYAYNDGKELKFTKNDKNRMCVRCTQPGCPFKINLWKVKNALSWRIATFHEEHDGCGWVYKNKLVKSTRIAKRWMKEIGHNSKWTTAEFRDRVKVDERFQLSRKQAYRAMRKAKAAIEGEAIENFNKIWSYCLEIERTNPRATCIVKLSDLMYEGKQRFVRMYFCWEASKEGYKFCRKIIGVDGCHLKSKFGGQMLTAIGIDGNDSIFPLAYAIVEGETKDYWSWFLELIRRDLEITREEEHLLTFISDKLKGLLPAFADVLPNVSHRFCVRHLHGNMKLAGFVGKAMKDALWVAAKATTVSTFKDAMVEIKNLDVEAYQWLGDKHPSEWSRSHFTPYAKSDALVNNISESFNALILDAREQPLISCVETIRKLLMAKFFDSRQKAITWKGPFCPNIMKKISMVEKDAAGCLGVQSDDSLFEIK